MRGKLVAFVYHENSFDKTKMGLSQNLHSARFHRVERVCLRNPRPAKQPTKLTAKHLLPQSDSFFEFQANLLSIFTRFCFYLN